MGGNCRWQWECYETGKNEVGNKYFIGLIRIFKQFSSRKDKEMQERRCEEKEYERAMSKMIQIKEENEPDVQVGENSKETKDKIADSNPLSIIKIG